MIAPGTELLVNSSPSPVPSSGYDFSVHVFNNHNSESEKQKQLDNYQDKQTQGVPLNHQCQNLYLSQHSTQYTLKVTNSEVNTPTLSHEAGRHYPHHPAQDEHLNKSRQYYRDMMLGVNDGLVSTFLLVTGVVGGGMDVGGVLLTAVSGTMAGATSMFAGEFVATKSQNEVLRGEISLENDHVRKYPKEEIQELSRLLSLIGIPSDSHNDCMNDDTFDAATSDGTEHYHNMGGTNLKDVELGNDVNHDNISSSIENNNVKITIDNLNKDVDALELKQLITKYYSSNPDALLKIMIALEFGIIGNEVRSPLVAGGTSFLLFFLGALPSTIPFLLCGDSTMIGMICAGIATGMGLIFVGAAKTWATRGNLLRSALENLFITVAGGAVAYGIGACFHRMINGEDDEI